MSTAMTRRPIPDDALTKHIAILGKTGSGKSNLAKLVAADLMSKGERVCVIDPTGTWWGMRLMADGKTPSDFEMVIFGGQHADLPVGGTFGTAIASAIGSSATNTIIDTRQLTVGERTRFFTDFAETLVRKNRGVLSLVIDEAHLFMPQSGARTGGAAPAMLHAGNNLVSLGRGVGLRIVLISQRPAKLHKDSLTQVETLVAMRLIAPQDRKAIWEWVGEWTDDDGTTLTDSLPKLATGEAWVWSPETDHLKKSRCRLVSTFDSGYVEAQEVKTLPKIDVGEIAMRLEQVGEELLADDPKTLRKRIAELERELKTKGPSEEEERLRTEVAEFRRRVYECIKVLARCQRQAEEMWNLGDDVAKLLGELEEEPDLERPEPEAKSRREIEPQHRVPKPPAAGDKPNDELTGPQQRVLNAIGWLSGMRAGMSYPKVPIAFAARYTPNSGSFNNTVSSLRSAGLVDYPSPGQVELTPAGLASTEPQDAITDEELHANIFYCLNGPQEKLLRALIAYWPDEMSSEELAERTGYTANSGSFNNTRSRLRTLGLVDYPRPGLVRANDICFASVMP